MTDAMNDATEKGKQNSAHSQPPGINALVQQECRAAEKTQQGGKGIKAQESKQLTRARQCEK